MRTMRFATSMFAALCLSAGVASAQEDVNADADAAFPTGRDAATVGQAYIVGTNDAWEHRCIKVEEGQDPCEIYQLIKDDEGFSIAEIIIVDLPDGGAASAGATIVTPLGSLLAPGVVFAIDGKSPSRRNYGWCVAAGCVARFGLTPEELDAMLTGTRGTLTITPLSAPERPLTLLFSLGGFTAAYDAIKID